MSGIRWREEIRNGSGVGYRTGETDDGDFIAEWPGLGTFRGNARTTHFERAEGADPAYAAKLEHGVARAFTRHLEGKIALHGGAAGRDGNAIVLLGDSGSGKSTATAVLCARRGFSVLADDVVAIDAAASGYVVTPTEAHHWLRDGAWELLGLAGGPESEVVIGSGAPCEPAALGALVYLTRDDGATSVTLARMTGHEALTAIVRSTFRLWQGGQRRDLDHAAALCSSLPIWRLRRPINAPIDEVAEVLESTLELS